MAANGGQRDRDDIPCPADSLRGCVRLGNRRVESVNSSRVIWIDGIVLGDERVLVINPFVELTYLAAVLNVFILRNSIRVSVFIPLDRGSASVYDRLASTDLSVEASQLRFLTAKVTFHQFYLGVQGVQFLLVVVVPYLLSPKEKQVDGPESDPHPYE